jgi:flagellar assembly factor FliW
VAAPQRALEAASVAKKRRYSPMGTIKLNTANFGELEVEESGVVTFLQGIPGFEHIHRFTIVQLGEDIPFSYLQSVDDGELALLVTNPFVFYPDYEFKLTEAVKEDLHIDREEDILVVSVVSIRDSMEDATINLLAPIIINMRASLGKQVILHDTKYMTRHQLVPAQARAE